LSTKTLVAPPAGNRRAERHGFYVRQLRPLECDEVSEIADAIRALAPLDADGLEPAIQLLAGQIWRRKRALMRTWTATALPVAVPIAAAQPRS